jgi:hypothetical protein
MSNAEDKVSPGTQCMPGGSLVRERLDSPKAGMPLAPQAGIDSRHARRSGGRMNTTRPLEGVVLALGALALLTVTACSTATPTGTPGVERLGNTILHYRGPELDVLLSYRFASFNPGEDWLFLDVGITAETRTSVEIKREKIAIRTPTGAIIPLATQHEFGAAYPKLAPLLARADIASEPLDYYPGRRPKGLDLLVPPGSALALESVWVNDQEVAIGRLYFDIPAAVQPGPYELRIDLQETKIRIPFRLGPES